MLVQDFTACGLEDMHGLHINWLPSTKRHAGKSHPDLQPGGPQPPIIARVFLDLGIHFPVEIQ